VYQRFQQFLDYDGMTPSFGVRHLYRGKYRVINKSKTETQIHNLNDITWRHGVIPRRAKNRPKNGGENGNEKGG
jgi:hypothetical protein